MTGPPARRGAVRGERVGWFRWWFQVSLGGRSWTEPEFVYALRKKSVMARAQSRLWVTPNHESRRQIAALNRRYERKESNP